MGFVANNLTQSFRAWRRVPEILQTPGRLITGRMSRRFERRATRAFDSALDEQPH